MNRAQAKRIVEDNEIRIYQLKDTLLRAYDAGAADKRRSKVNRSFSLGYSFNCYWESLQCSGDYEIVNRPITKILAINILRDFGKYGEWEIEKLQPKPDETEPRHEEAFCPARERYG